jgi:hypothetical protein
VHSGQGRSNPDTGRKNLECLDNVRNSFRPIRCLELDHVIEESIEVVKDPCCELDSRHARASTRRLARSRSDRAPAFGPRCQIGFGLCPRHRPAASRHLRPALIRHAVEIVVAFDLFGSLGDGIEDEGVARLAAALGRHGDAGLQVILDADGGR